MKKIFVPAVTSVDYSGWANKILSIEVFRPLYLTGIILHSDLLLFLVCQIKRRLFSQLLGKVPLPLTLVTRVSIQSQVRHPNFNRFRAFEMGQGKYI